MGEGQYLANRLVMESRKSKHEFICPSNCSSSTFDFDEMTVFAEAHHMHNYGKRLVSEVIRGDTIVNTAVIDYWDFDQNGVVLVQQKPYKLKKGDSYRSTCYFESDGNQTYGIASTEEMCISSIYYSYYPKQSGFSNCGPSNEQAPMECSSSFSSSILE